MKLKIFALMLFVSVLCVSFCGCKKGITPDSKPVYIVSINHQKHFATKIPFKSNKKYHISVAPYSKTDKKPAIKL